MYKSEDWGEIDFAILFLVCSKCISWQHSPSHPDFKLTLGIKKFLSSFSQFCDGAFEVKYVGSLSIYQLGCNQKRRHRNLIYDLNHFENLSVGKVWGFFLLLHYFLRCRLHLVETRLPWQESIDDTSARISQKLF